MDRSKKIQLITCLLIFIICALSLIFLSSSPAMAKGLIPEPSGPDGDYTLCDVLKLFVNVAKYILGAVGGLALILFLWGGFGLITAGGSSEKIEANKKLLVGTIFGLVIVLFAWQLVYSVIFLLTGSAKENAFGVATPEGFEQVLQSCVTQQSTRGLGGGTKSESRKFKSESSITD